MEEIPTWDWGDDKSERVPCPEPPTWMNVIACLFWLGVLTGLFVLLASKLLATDCRVHRVPMADTVGCEIAVGVVSRMPQGCLTKSHWIDTCKMRCDTVWTHRYWIEQTPDGTRGREDSFRVIDCYPDTAESDSGLITWFGVAPLPPPDSYLPRSYPAPLDSAELSDIREMLREWREKRAKDSINTAEHAVHQTCPKCGKCKPRDSGWIECTAMWCTDGCCNGCTYTFFCANTDDEFTVTINECDWIVWDTTNGEEK